MNKLFAVLAPLFVASTVMAAPEAEGAAEAAAAAGPMVLGLAAGLAVLGAGLGIGRIGGTACGSHCPSARSEGVRLRNMLLTAALIEGVAFAAVILVG